MSKSAINFKSLGYNLTILAYDHMLFNYMEDIENQMEKLVQKNREYIKSDILVAIMRHDLKTKYKNFFKNPSLQNNGETEWNDFITSSIAYFFTRAYFYNTPIKLVKLEVFDEVIKKGIYVNLTNGDTPDLVEGIDYIKYVGV